MRFILNGPKKALIENGHSKCNVTKFLIFPLCINGELRWFERASWIRQPDCKYTFFFNRKKYYWKNKEWTDDKNI